MDISKSSEVNKLLIHDLDEDEWIKIAADYTGWTIVSDQGKIRPCMGCFGCWVKKPGICVIKDGYERMGMLIHNAAEVVVITRYTYGGFSSFVKNVIDRSIGWVLPYFEIYENEMHHKKRYPENKPFTFIFRSNGLTDEEKVQARKYAEAVCRNYRAELKEICFEKCGPALDPRSLRASSQLSDPGRMIVLNCSLRGSESNSKKFLDRLVPMLAGEPENINLSAYLSRLDELVDMLLSAGRIVLGMPLYVDGIPSPVLRIMEKMEQYIPDRKSVYVVANMGFYESVQLRNLLGMVRAWCDKCGYTDGGGLAIGAGEMQGGMMSVARIDKGPAKNISEGMEKLAETINACSESDDIYADVYKFPRGLYMFAANLGWPRKGRKNGLKRKELLKRCDAE